MVFDNLVFRHLYRCEACGIEVVVPSLSKEPQTYWRVRCPKCGSLLEKNSEEKEKEPFNPSRRD